MRACSDDALFCSCASAPTVNPRCSEGGEGGGGGGDALRVLLDRFDDPLCFVFISPFCSSSSFSSLLSSCACTSSSSFFLENDLRGRGGGSNTRLCCGTTSTGSDLGMSSFSSASSCKGCMTWFSILNDFGSRVLGVAAPALCPDGVSGEMGSGILCENKNNFFHNKINTTINT